MTLRDAVPELINVSQPLPWLLVSGQPTEQQLRTLAEAGLKTVIDIREPMEPRGLEEPDVVQSLGMRYINLPVVSGALENEIMAQLLDALHRNRGVPTLLHCNSANRTGGPLIAYLMRYEAMDQSDAIDVATRSGLRSMEIMEWGVEGGHTGGGESAC